MTKSGYTGSFLINTKGKGTPSYLTEWFLAFYRDNCELVEVSEIFDITNTIPHWQESWPSLQKGHTLLQGVLRLNEKLGLDEKDFEHYVMQFYVGQILPYIEGCGFDGLGVYIQFQPPEEIFGIGIKGGERSVLIKKNNCDNTIKQILVDLFGYDHDKITRYELCMESMGEYKLENALPSKYVPDFVELMERAGIKEFEVY